MSSLKIVIRDEKDVIFYYIDPQILSCFKFVITPDKPYGYFMLNLNKENAFRVYLKTCADFMKFEQDFLNWFSHKKFDAVITTEELMVYDDNDEEHKIVDKFVSFEVSTHH